MSDIDLAALAKRSAWLEDQQLIRDVIARYCLAADAGDANAVRPLFTADAAVDIDKAVFMTGAEEVSASFLSPAHQGMLPNGAHLTGPFLVEIEGDRAVATGYMALFFKQDSVGLARLSLGRWELRKADGHWRIARRTARSVGRDDTRALIDAAGRP